MSQTLPNPPQGGGTAADRNTPGIDPGTIAGKGPGGSYVGVFGIVGLIAYLVLFTLFLIYGLVKVWPVPTPSRETADAHPTATPTPTVTQAPTQTPTPAQSPTATPSAGGAAGQTSPTPSPSPSPSASPLPEPVTVSFFVWQFKLWDEQRLLLLVLLAGALGSILHDLRSVYWYVGNRNLVRSWLAMFVVLPFAGATLALIFYLVVRGGFFSPQSSFKDTSPFGLAALAALVGMFSPQAVLKLKEVAETLLAKPGPGANSQPQATAHPSSPPTAPAAPPAGTPTIPPPPPIPESATTPPGGNNT